MDITRFPARSAGGFWILLGEIQSKSYGNNKISGAKRREKFRPFGGKYKKKSMNVTRIPARNAGNSLGPFGQNSQGILLK